MALGYHEDIKLHEKRRLREYLLTEKGIVTFGENNKKPATQGVCPKCGAKVLRVGKS